MGLVSHESKRTNPKLGVQTDTASDNNVPGISLGGDPRQDNDLRDGYVFFGCKKSIKQH